MCCKTKEQKRQEFLEKKKAELAVSYKILPHEEEEELRRLQNQGKALKKEVARLVWEASK